ncbi:MAG TPA: amino acid permease [Cyclobacteriaceae bacterium]|jgi:amino acid transporter|nr:amino acid permease [Cyclobacteriaceae bacterium]
MLRSLFRKKSLSTITSTSHAADGQASELKKVLNARDLTLLGIAAIIGAGIFSTIGHASFNGGPAVSLLFVFTAVACVFTALSYAQFASTVPVSGSAYTYAYVSFGEFFAWIIGWALILEYAVSNMVVAISWSEYFTSMLAGFNIHLPEWLTIDPSSASEAVRAAAPSLVGIKLICDLPAGLITVLVTALVYVGIRESRTASNILVILKLCVIFLVIVAGSFYIKPENWSPFAPNGVKGILSSVAAVFFAFIGFDSISTTAEECKNPQRDLPRAMLWCLGICTVLYILIALVLTGMVNYKELNVDDPLAYVFQKVGVNFIAGVISVSAVVAITSALLVYQLGQPRIWMTMSRDGLLWPRFAKVHPKFKTPSFSTIVTGVVVAVPSMFFNMQFFVDLTSVGTFFAFIIVCAGVLYMDQKGLSNQSKFRVPYINGKYFVVAGLFIAAVFALTSNGYAAVLAEKPLLYVFWATWILMSVLSYKNSFSLLPVLGILTNLYLMTELGLWNWGAFLTWLIVGLVIYFSYGYRKSKLATT